MPTNPHALRLEEERRGLLRQKTNIKRFLEQAPFRLDSVDLAVARRNAAMQLNGLQKQYEKVCYELGISSDTRAVKLDVPVRTTTAPRTEHRGAVYFGNHAKSATGSRLNQVKNTLASGGYLTRAMGSRTGR